MIYLASDHCEAMAANKVKGFNCLENTTVLMCF